MKYDFTLIMNRQGKDAIAVDAPISGKDGFEECHIKEGFDVIPMWVADMNFPTVPSIQESIIQRVQHPAFGYFDPSDDYYNSIIDWQAKRHNITNLESKHIGYENGVLGGVISALNVLCSKGDKVLLHSPTYIGFTHCMKNNGYDMILSPMYKDNDGIWRMNYEDMEDKIIKNNIHAAVFCSPHNPTGRVWEKEEIEKAMEIYAKHDVYVISDEIWSDLILNGYNHIPTQSINEWTRNHVIALYAPSKTFNLAGLIGSYHIIYNDYLRERIDKESSLCHYNSMNVLSMHALIGAYKKDGHEWLDQLLEVLTENINYGYEYITNNFKGVTLSKPQGTYMLFLDCTDWCKEHNLTIDELIKLGWSYGVIWQDGRPFHSEYGIRMNLALPTSRVKEAFDRLNKYVFNTK